MFKQGKFSLAHLITILSFAVICFIALSSAPRLDVFLSLAIVGFLLAFRFRMEPTLSEEKKALAEWLPKWESENIKLSEIENLEDEKVKEEYIDKFAKSYFRLIPREMNKQVKKRTLNYYVQLPRIIDLGLVDEVFGILFAVFLANTLLKIDAHLFVELLILFILSILICSIALAAIAVRGKEIFFIIACSLILGLMFLIKDVQPAVYRENDFKILGFSIIFWYITKEMTQYFINKYPKN